MKSYNNVTLIGRAVKDVEFSSVGNDNNRAMFTLAVDRPYKDSDGRHPVDFLNIVTWGKLAEICGDYIVKGALVMVSGRIQSRAYTVNEETKWITEIVAETVNILEYRNNNSNMESITEILED